MAFDTKEKEIINYGLRNGKSRQEVEQALTRYRTGVPTSMQNKTEPNEVDGSMKPSQPSYLSRVTDAVGQDISTRTDKMGEILNRNTEAPAITNKLLPITKPGTNKNLHVEQGVQAFGQGAGMAANALETTVTEIPGVKQAVGAVGSGIDWLAKSDLSPIKYLGDAIGSSKALQEAVKLYDTDKNFKDTVDGVANIARLGGDIQTAVDSANFVSKVTNKLVSKTAASPKVDSVIEGHFQESNDVIKSLPPEELNSLGGMKELIQRTKTNIVDGLKGSGMETDAARVNAIDISKFNTLDEFKNAALPKSSPIADVVGAGSKVVNDAKSLAGKSLQGKDAKLLSIFTGEGVDVVESALKDPVTADIGIKGGDSALREVVNKGSEASIKAKQAFIQGQADAVKQIVGGTKSKVSRQKVLYQFVDDLNAAGVKIKNGEIDFSTSKINTNPGEVGKIKAAYKAIQNWTDWSVEGTHELKQLVGGYTRFANEAGGTSKSPFLGKFYYTLNETIKDTLPSAKAKAYEDLNRKFTNNIDLYNDMVDAFNSGDPFTKLSQLFGANKDSLRQIVDFYEKTTGNKVSPVVAGRTLAQEKAVSPFLFTPRAMIDFFINPKVQASLVTKVGKIKKSK